MLSSITCEKKNAKMKQTKKLSETKQCLVSLFTYKKCRTLREKRY